MFPFGCANPLGTIEPDPFWGGAAKLFDSIRPGQATESTLRGPRRRAKLVSYDASDRYEKLRIDRHRSLEAHQGRLEKSPSPRGRREANMGDARRLRGPADES